MQTTYSESSHGNGIRFLTHDQDGHTFPLCWKYDLHVFHVYFGEDFFVKYHCQACVCQV